MKRSDHRILTTHAGRLDGPPELVKLSRDVMAGLVADASALRPAVQRGIVDVIRRQAGAGVDVISDGEVGKFGFGSLTYYGRRLSGLTTRPLKPGEAPFMPGGAMPSGKENPTLKPRGREKRDRHAY